MLLVGIGYDRAKELPSWPWSLLPQHLVEPDESIPQVCRSPQLTLENDSDIKVGEDFEIVEPSPSCP